MAQAVAPAAARPLTHTVAQAAARAYAVALAEDGLAPESSEEGPLSNAALDGLAGCQEAREARLPWLPGCPAAQPLWERAKGRSRGPRYSSRMANIIVSDDSVNTLCRGVRPLGS